MTYKEKIEAELERLKYAFNQDADIASAEDAVGENIAQAKYELCCALLDFSNSLPKEPVSEDLEEEAEDEKIRLAIKYGLDHVFTKNTIIYEVRKEQCLAWLKKQGEQKPAWKPSEEDLIYLKSAAENYDFCDGERTALMNLYNDLKKLMEE